MVTASFPEESRCVWIRIGGQDHIHDCPNLERGITLRGQVTGGSPEPFEDGVDLRMIFRVRAGSKGTSDDHRRRLD